MIYLARINQKNSGVRSRCQVPLRSFIRWHLYYIVIITIKITYNIHTVYDDAAFYL